MTFSIVFFIFRFTLPQKLCIPNLVILSRLWRNFTFQGPKSPKKDPKMPPKMTFSNFFFIFHFPLPQRLCIPNLVILSQLWRNFTFQGPKSPKKKTLKRPQNDFFQFFLHISISGDLCSLPGETSNTHTTRARNCSYWWESLQVSTL